MLLQVGEVVGEDILKVIFHFGHEPFKLGLAPCFHVAQVAEIVLAYYPY